MKDPKKKYKEINLKLLEDCKKGSRKAQNEIYRLYYMAMYNTSLRIVKTKEDAEDIMQESFLKAFRNLDNFSGEVSFGAWLKKIVINGSLDYLRKRSALFEELEDQKLSDIPDDTGGHEGPDISTEQIRKEIMALPDGYRVVLSLYLLEGYDHDEIAEILDIKSSTSRSQYIRAKKKLSHNLKKYL